MTVGLMVSRGRKELLVSYGILRGPHKALFSPSPDPSLSSETVGLRHGVGSVEQHKQQVVMGEASIACHPNTYAMTSGFPVAFSMRLMIFATEGSLVARSWGARITCR